MPPYRSNIKDEQNFRTLFQNSVMLVGHVFETAYCYNKLTQKESVIFTFDNDPTCAAVGNNNDWCLVGGDVLVLQTWTGKPLQVIRELRDIFELKVRDAYTVHILTDPWNEQSAIWQLNMDSKKPASSTSLYKLRDFREYIGKPYTDQINW